VNQTFDPSLMRRYLVPFKAHRLPLVPTDVLIIGSGVAGLRAALAAAEFGEVTILTKNQKHESNSFYAQGGVASVWRPDDSFAQHVQDTIKAGCGLCDLAAVEAMVREAPIQIDQLLGWGVNFDRELGGTLAVTREGGHSSPRILHALGDATGKELANCLMYQVTQRESVQLLENTFVLDLLTVDNECLGAIAWSAERGLFLVRARITILASGGAGMLFRETTNPAIATADGQAMAYRAGATFRGPELVQFHPTTLYIAGATRALISEAVRGEGAPLIDRSGYRFMPDYHPDAELAPRDVVSRAILAQMAKTQTTHVYLDARHLTETAFQERFPGIFKMCMSFGINPSRKPIPVHPSCHYMVGGMKTDLFGRTGVNNLLAVGEVAYTGLHGANRLGSNSLIEALVFGARAGMLAGQQVASDNTEIKVPRFTTTVSASPRTELDLADVRSSLRSLMWRNAGIERCGERLSESLEIIGFWSRYVLDKTLDSPAGWEVQNMLEIAWLMTQGALARAETRGVHYRTDYPLLRPEWNVHLDYIFGANEPLLTAVK
jgi:L-aspartate oxidase